MLTSAEEWLQSGDFFNYRDFKIFFNQFGEGDDLIIIHGYPFSSYEWKDLIPKLSATFRVTIFDLLGFGFSDKPDNHYYSFSEYSNILTSLAMHLKIVETHIICHDLGVSIVQEHLAKTMDFGMPFKISSICFTNGNLFSDAYKPRFIQRVLSQSPSFIGRVVSKKISKKSVYKAISDLHGLYTKPEKNYFDELWKILNYNNGKDISYLLGKLVFEKAKHQQRWLNAMSNTDIPMCYLCGPADPNSGIYMALTFQKKLPGKSILWMPDHIGHWPMTEDPNIFYEVYFDWLHKQDCRKLQARVGEN